MLEPRSRPPADARVLVAIFAGGCVGAMTRAELSVVLAYEPGEWPWATLIVNVAGALVLGWVITRIEDGREPFPHAGRLLGTGFCGALTTFSAMQLELLQMLDEGRYGLAAAYTVVSLAAGLAAVVLATRLTRRGGAAPAPT